MCVHLPTLHLPTDPYTIQVWGGWVDVGVGVGWVDRWADVGVGGWVGWWVGVGVGR